MATEQQTQETQSTQQTSQTQGTQQTSQSTNTSGAQQTTQQTSQTDGTNRTGGSNTQETKSFSYKEDRSKWIPPHRFKETTDAHSTLKTENERLQAQIKALTGQQTPDPDSEKLEIVKQTMRKLYPWMGKLENLTEEQMDRVLKAADRAEASEEYIQQGQTRHAKSMLNKVVASVKEQAGDLSDRAQANIKAAFTSFIEREVSKTEESGELTEVLQRYIDGDETVAQEFADQWFEDFGKPIRRQVTNEEISRGRKVPNSTGRSQQTQVQRPEKFNSLDDRLDYAVKVAKERGVQFGR